MRKKPVLFLGRTEAPRPREAEDALATFDAGERGEWWWRQPRRWRPEWRLEAGGRLVATFSRGAVFARTTHVQFEGESFEVVRGLTGRRELRREGGVEALARYVPGWLVGGRIELAGGDALVLKPSGFWMTAHEIRTPDGLGLLRFESREGFLRREVRLRIEDAARRRPDLAQLLALGGALVLSPPKQQH
jgi:hypothetical protein